MTTKFQKYTLPTNPERKQNRQSRVCYSIKAHLPLQIKVLIFCGGKRAFNLPTQIGLLRNIYAHLAPLSQKRKPQAYGIILYLITINCFAQMGGTADDVINQINKQAAIQMGAPFYKGEFLTTQKEKSKQYEELNKEIKNDERINDYLLNYTKNNSSNSTVDVSNYKSAFNKISNMLSGKTPLSVKDSYYYAETAYGGSYLSKDDYDNTIKESADFIKKWLTEKQYPLTPYNIQLAIQDFMSDTLAVKIYMPDSKEKYQIKKHLPYKYDYDDYDGKKDYRNYFATKCLATGTGQCASMPSVHLIFSEMLGVNSYLSFAPFHSFIKFKDNKDNLANYEPTSNWALSDKWYQEHLFISPQAKKSGIYLDTLNKKQVVANCLVDMVISYLSKTSNPDTNFTNQCLVKAQKYFPKRNNIYIHLAKSQILNYQLYHSMQKNKIKDVNQIPPNSDTNKIYQNLIKNEQLISSLGYQDLPKQLYDQLIEQQNNKTKDKNAKTTKTLFQNQ